MRTALAGLLLLLSSAASIARAQQEQTVRVALVLGHNGADRSDKQSLRYADDDAVATHNLLTEAGVHSTLLVAPDPDTVELNPELTWLAPTLEAVSQAVGTLKKKVQEAKLRGSRVEFILFYSGHGDVDADEGYVTLAGGRLTRSQLYTLLTEVGATRNHVVIDACRSYYLVFGRGPGGHRTPYRGAVPDAYLPAELANTGFVLSTASDRESHEWERFRSGIFSHEVRSALRGGADLDQDGEITYAELGAFIEKANRSVLARFRPEVFVRAPADRYADVVLAWSTPASFALLPSDWGHVYIEGPRGERLADLHPSQHASLAIRAPRDRPLFVRKHDQSLEYVLDAPGPAFVSPRDGRIPTVMARGAVSLAFEGLFASPLTWDDVERFARGRESSAEIQDGHSLDVASPARMKRAISWSLGGATLAVLSGALGTWVRARHTEKDLRKECGGDELCPDGSRWRSLQSGARRQARWSYALSAVGGAAALTALSVHFWIKPRTAGPAWSAAGLVDCDVLTCSARVSAQW